MNKRGMVEKLNYYEVEKPKVITYTMYRVDGVISKQTRTLSGFYWKLKDNYSKA